MKIGVAPHPLWPHDGRDLEKLTDTARKIEGFGFDHVIVGDHVLAGDWGLSPDPVVTLAALAGSTSIVRLITSVLVLPLHNPLVLGHQVATLDSISRGRFVLGVGAGWNEVEFTAIGVPFDERGARVDESLTVMKQLWGDEARDFDGRFTSFHESRLASAPQSEGGPPIWVGGESDAALRRALRFGSAWHGSLDPTSAVTMNRRFNRLRQEDPSAATTIPFAAVCFLTPPVVSQVRATPGLPLGGTRPSRESVLEELALLEEAGVTSCSIWMPTHGRDFENALEWLAEEILPSVSN
jgi:probable F420-dependent oxidoreductase